MGSQSRKIDLTQGAMSWVEGERKYTLMTHTVKLMLNVTSTIVKRRYFPMSGTAKLDGGMISVSSLSIRLMDIKKKRFKQLAY